MSENNNTFISKEDGESLLKVALGLAAVPLALRGSRKAFGRVMTNLIQPTGYQHKMSQLVYNLSPNTDLPYIYKYGKKFLDDPLKYGRNPKHKPIYPNTQSEIKKESTKALKRAINSVRYDKPVWDMPGVVKKSSPKTVANYANIDEVLEAREFPYRAMYNLKPRQGQNVYIKNPKKNIFSKQTYSFNPDNPIGKRMIQSVSDAAEYGMKPEKHPTMGGYTLKLIKDKFDKSGKLVEKGGYYFEDAWDLKLHKSLLSNPSPERLARYIADKMSKPVTVKGKAPIRRQSKFDDINEQSIIEEFIAEEVVPKF